MMAEPKKKSSLFIGHFGRGGDIPASSDPIGVTSMLVPVDRIAFFDDNPRRGRKSSTRP